MLTGVNLQYSAHKKGQISVEFTIALAVYLMILLAAFAIYLNVSDTTLYRIKYLKAKNTADMLASRINGLETHVEGKGEASVDASLNRPDYNITIEDGGLKVDFDGAVAYSHLKTSNIYLNFTGTELKIKFKEGVIYVNDAQ